MTRTSADTNSLFMFHSAALTDEMKDRFKKEFGSYGALGTSLAAALGTSMANRMCSGHQTSGRRIIEEKTRVGAGERQDYCYTPQELSEGKMSMVDAVVDMSGTGLLDQPVFSPPPRPSPARR